MGQGGRDACSSYNITVNEVFYCCSLPCLAIILANGRTQLMFNAFLLSRWQVSNHEELSPLFYHFEDAPIRVLGTDRLRLEWH